MTITPCSRSILESLSLLPSPLAATEWPPLHGQPLRLQRGLRGSRPQVHGGVAASAGTRDRLPR